MCQGRAVGPCAQSAYELVHLSAQLAGAGGLLSPLTNHNYRLVGEWGEPSQPGDDLGLRHSALVCFHVLL